LQTDLSPIEPTTKPMPAHLPQIAHPRNPGMPLDLDWVAAVQANTSAIERRAATLPGRRSVKKEFQAAWLCKAISLIDLTTLSGDDTEGRVRRLCAKARQPVRPDLLDRLGMTALTTGAVCVYHDMVETAVRALEGTRIPWPPCPPDFRPGSRPTSCGWPKSAKA
jgi:deoxyribose-phosphate aldolase